MSGFARAEWHLRAVANMSSLAASLLPDPEHSAAASSLLVAGYVVAAPSPVAFKGCGRRGGCRDWKAVQASFLAGNWGTRSLSVTIFFISSRFGKAALRAGDAKMGPHPKHIYIVRRDGRELDRKST